MPPSRPPAGTPAYLRVAKHAVPVVLLCIAAALALRGRGNHDEVPYVAPPPAMSAPEAPSWRAAARKVEEPRGEPMGRAATVRIPPELRHYSDPRRFLAVQVAGWREQGYPLPHDDADLAEMVQRGDLVAVPVVGEHYILYGAGANASDEPLFHFETSTGEHIPLFARYDLYEDAVQGWRDDVARLHGEDAARTAELRGVPRAERKRRAALTAAIKQAKAAAAALEKRLAAVAPYYEDEVRRRHMTREWAVLHEIAATFPGHYDLDTAHDRRVMRARLLSYIRPPARDMMAEIAAAYDARFSRPIAFTSLVRSEEYQRALGETNPNATRIAVAPHTTGLAFDLYYRYMSAAELTFVMDLIARLEDDGRLEALRENRDHIHIFAFATGRRPAENLIAEALDDVRPVWAAQGRGSSATRKASLGKRAPSRKAGRKAPAARKPRIPTKAAAAGAAGD